MRGVSPYLHPAMPPAPDAEPVVPAPALRRWRARVLDHRHLSPTGCELTLSRDGLAFRAGQLLTIHGRDVLEDRNYTIASGERDDCLQVLYRVIPAGKLTPQLAQLRPGDTVEVSGPYGEFVLRDATRPIVFIATGTGIAPCRAYVRTHAGLDLTVLHGVRRAEDLFYREDFAGRPYHPCTSAEAGPGYHGRVTDLSRTLAFPAGSHFYLCGANEMFYDMRDLLRARGVDSGCIFTEAYYYRFDE